MRNLAQDRHPMSPTRRSLECRASLLALAIASAGASVHLAIEVVADLWSDGERVVPIRCPDAEPLGPSAAPLGPELGPDDLEAIELRCRSAGAARCEMALALPMQRAVEATLTLFGPETPDQALLRFSPVHHRVVWTLRAHEAGLTANVDAFDAGVVEFSADGVTTN
jgi:hypothetical protein